MITSQAIAVGCNRELQVFDYSSQLNLIAYGSTNAVAVTAPLLGDPIDMKVDRILKSQKGMVTAVCWLPDGKTLLSGSEDSTVSVWKYDEDWNLKQTIAHGQGSITCIAPIGSDSIVIGQGSGNLGIWTSKDGNFELKSEFSIKDGFYPLCVRTIEIEGRSIMFIGGTHTTLFVYTLDVEPLLVAELPGHEDWIKALAIKKLSDDEYLVASGSQDRWIRLWNLQLDGQIKESDQDSNELSLLTNKQYRFSLGEIKCAIQFDTIIFGHDDWISDLQWHPTQVRLLSSSADSTVMIWEADASSGVWVSTTRLGELAIKGASTAAGAAGGFWGSKWIIQPQRDLIVTNGKTGSFRCWQSKADSYVQIDAVTGPLKDVTDVEWSPNGDYLLVTSLDQTTRLFAQWTHVNETRRPVATWHEFGRPQIHGYDMICVKALSETQFVSAGDEKVIRVFEEPRTVAKMMESLTDVCEIGSESITSQSASLPTLGLSNKAEADTENQENEDEKAVNMLQSLAIPPLEDHLQRYTLWPETQKLYGHGFEVTTLDISSDGKLIASACRSNSAKHAVIRVFSTSNWKQLDQTLPGHDLTITRVRFSPNGQYLLSVSRDRKFSLWKRTKDQFELVCLQEKAHTRIIWDCCWLDNETFVTGSRDRKLKVWKIGQDVQLVSEERLDSVVTALDSGHGLIAVGLESGDLWLYKYTDRLQVYEKVPEAVTADSMVSRVAFRPGEKAELAVGSSDHSIRILSIEN